ncbi:hypothetical protein BHM03_00050118, partial [Ensete ventricosum]
QKPSFELSGKLTEETNRVQDMEENRVEPQYGIMHFLKRVLLGLAIVGIN